MTNFKLLAAALATAVITLPAVAQDMTTTIRVGNWLPPHHLIVSGILQPWADAIEARAASTFAADAPTACRAASRLASAACTPSS